MGATQGSRLGHEIATIITSMTILLVIQNEVYSRNMPTSMCKWIFCWPAGLEYLTVYKIIYHSSDVVGNFLAVNIYATSM